MKWMLDFPRMDTTDLLQHLKLRLDIAQRRFAELMIICDAVGGSSQASAVLPSSEMYLDGRMLDTTTTVSVKVKVADFSSHSSVTTSSATLDPQTFVSADDWDLLRSSDHRRKVTLVSRQLVRAICIMDPANAHLLGGGSEESPPVLKLGPKGLRDHESIQLRSVRRLCSVLKKHEVTFILCCEAVEGACRNEIATNGILVVCALFKQSTDFC
jgi:hypothetical protein